MTKSESIAAIGAAMAKAQGQMAGAAKDSKNPHFNSSYADLASIVDACRLALASNGIAVMQSPSTHDGNLVRMKTLLTHSSGEWIESDELQVQSRDAGPQAVGSCLTYLRRYQLAGMVGVAPEDDDAEKGESRCPHCGKDTAKAPKAEYYHKDAPDSARSSASNPPYPTTKPPVVQKSAPMVWGKKVATNVAASMPPEPPPLTDKDIPF